MFLGNLASASAAKEQAADPLAPTIDEELKAMQGLWKVTSAEIGEKPTDVQQMGMQTIRIAGTKMTLSNGDKVLMNIELKIDPSKSPKEMDWNDPKRGYYPLIYSLEKDTLKLCFPLDKLGAPLVRPQTFKNPDKPITVLNAERQKE